MDLYPTMCEAAGAKFDHEIDGRSILPTLLGEDQPVEDRYLFWVRLEGGHYGGRPYYAARKGDFKLVHNIAFEPMELYNLKEDPGEERPLPRNHKMYSRHIVAEEFSIDKNAWIEVSRHNHWLDATVYAFAALSMLRPICIIGAPVQIADVTPKPAGGGHNRSHQPMPTRGSGRTSIF